jgi:Fic family protein
MAEKKTRFRAAGYEFLLKKLGIVGMPTWHRSFVGGTIGSRFVADDGVVEEIYRGTYWPSEGVGEHLEFALKYDGVNLSLLAQIFEKLDVAELVAYIKSKPTGKYVRRLWFFYEFLTEKLLPVDDLSIGNYVEALESEAYFVLQRGEKSQRHRVVNNLLGSKDFCPVVRKSETLAKLAGLDLHEKCEAVVSAYSSELLRRALSYFYHKETKSSFEIEGLTSSSSSLETFVALLRLAEKDDYCQKERLIELQNYLVDGRFKDKDYRVRQNYVGQSFAYKNELVHFVGPKPNDLPALMAGLISCHRQMLGSGLPSVIHAAIVSYGFVFLHPFEDGNGRIHRFLIHNVLSLHKAVPKGLMFPVSAVMLRDSMAYDASLEAFSRPLLRLIDYILDGVGQMTVQNPTALWYRYIDMTAQAEALYQFVVKTIDEELVTELNYLSSYDEAKRAILSIVEMPQSKLDLLVRLCIDNKGKLSAKKRANHFNFLSDQELMDIEKAIQTAFFAIKNA